MGHHRVAPTGTSRSDLGTPDTPADTPAVTPAYRGRRVATVPVDSAATTAAPAAPYVGRRVARPAPVVTVEPVTASAGRLDTGPGLDAGTVDRILADLEPVDHTTSFASDPTELLPLTPARPGLSHPETAELRTAGRRKAVKHAGDRGALLRRMPSVPVLVGIAALAVSVGGAVTVTDTDLAAQEAAPVGPSSALTGSSGGGVVGLDREERISRDSSRDALGDLADERLVEAAEAQAAERNTELRTLANAAEVQSKKIEANQWVLPLSGYRLTARYGEYGLWATYHTGLDFAAPTGTPLVAIANGTITSTGYDGAYGNKTVLTLEDGTELWFCHQTSIDVSPGETVTAGQQIGTVGSTGNVTGPHLHLEVRPGGGDPVDPYEALSVNGVTP